MQEKTQNRIRIDFKEAASGGSVLNVMFSLQNYYQTGSSLADYDKLQYLSILNPSLMWNPRSIYYDPETYKNFPDIRYLVVSEMVQKAAEEKGIDGYGYWPELEEVEVY